MSRRERSWWTAASVLAAGAAFAVMVASGKRAHRLAYIAGMHAGERAAGIRDRIRAREEEGMS